jgi:hypothetical protein
METYASTLEFNYWSLLCLLFFLVFIVIGIIKNIYMIKALRVYLKKHKNN